MKPVTITFILHIYATIPYESNNFFSVKKNPPRREAEIVENERAARPALLQ
jgi:hypothetical protein